MRYLQPRKGWTLFTEPGASAVLLAALFLQLLAVHGLPQSKRQSCMFRECSQVESEAAAAEILAKPLLADEKRYCPPSSEPRNRFHLRGTNLGGWLIIEPWITPSLFYQFLGASERWGSDAAKHVAIDSLTFCKALGKKEANRQLRKHWETWVTEEQIANLARIGVETLRIPVADWMFQPYEPFIGCWDGALEELDRGLALIQKYNMTAILDLHAVRGSQNGLDNSGDTGHYTWHYSDEQHELYYQHWLTRGGAWAGEFNTTTRSYSSLNVSRVMETVHVFHKILLRYQHHPILIGIQPLNEPEDTIPLSLIQAFYWRCYQLVRILCPHWITLLHDSYRLTLDHWGHHLPRAASRSLTESGPFSAAAAVSSPSSPSLLSSSLSANLSQVPVQALPSSIPYFLANCDRYAIDTHRYQAWLEDRPWQDVLNTACTNGVYFRELEQRGIPILVGEWSLATDNCMLWLSGWNDNVPGYPKVQCTRVPCPASYLPSQPGTPLNVSQAKQGPFGLGGPSYVEFGTCPIDRVTENQHEELKAFANAQLHAFELSTHGFFFWNFRTELPSPRWDYQRAVAEGYLPREWKTPEALRVMQQGCDGFYANLGSENRYHDFVFSPEEDGNILPEEGGGWWARLAWLSVGYLIITIYYRWKERKVATQEERDTRHHSTSTRVDETTALLAGQTV